MLNENFTKQELFHFINNEIFCIQTLGIFMFHYNRIKLKRAEISKITSSYFSSEESDVMESFRLICRLAKTVGTLKYIDDKNIKSQYWNIYGYNGKASITTEWLQDALYLYEVYILKQDRVAMMIDYIEKRSI